MKPGFKPKAWTAKEWLDAKPSDKTKGSGVEAALDMWQKHCKKKFGDMTHNEAAKAQATANSLSKAMTVASKKCDLKTDKDTLAAILEYKKRADDYANFAKQAMDIHLKRTAYTNSFTGLNKLLTDAEAFKVFEVYAKKKALIWDVVHTYLLCKGKQYQKAVQLYGKNNDYNIPAPMNKILLDTFINKVRHDQKDVLAAIKSLETEVSPDSQMLKDSRHYDTAGGFKTIPEWKALLAKKFPCKEYVVA